ASDQTSEQREPQRRDAFSYAVWSPYGNSGQAHCACRRRQKLKREQNKKKLYPQPPPAKVTRIGLVIRQQTAASRQTQTGRLEGAGAAAENQ
ncbi:MAG: hypothetical protein IKE64_10585, partial [Thermoguttaceae bacterium]|nr:hypothetical protein [Thermoguttaceae bacterium]